MEPLSHGRLSPRHMTYIFLLLRPMLHKTSPSPWGRASVPALIYDHLQLLSGNNVNN
jgi:hypothetical protein